MSNIPIEVILSHILPKLPVRSLSRFKSVCKEWQSTISSSDFNQAYVSTQNIPLCHRTNHGLLVVPKLDQWETSRTLPSLYAIQNKPSYDRESNNNDTLYKAAKLPGNPILDMRRHTFLGSCHGLICFQRYTKPLHGIWLLNPLTGEIMEIPDPNLVYQPPRLSRPLWAFGYVPSSDEYKLVRLVRFSPTKLYVQVFSSRDKQWNMLRSDGLGLSKEVMKNYWHSSDRDDIDGVGLESSGKHHWLMKHHDKSQLLILELDLVTETLDTIPWPVDLSEILVKGHYRCVFLGSFKESLTIFYQYNSVLQLWMMRPGWGSWSKILNLRIPSSPSIGTVNGIMACCADCWLGKNGGIFVMHSQSGVFLVDHTKEHVKFVKLVDDDEPNRADDKESSIDEIFRPYMMMPMRKRKSLPVSWFSRDYIPTYLSPSVILRP